MTALDAVFKAYDVRGTVPEQLDGRRCRAIGWAFAHFVGTSRILVARDMRASGAELSAAFATGARRAGATVVDLGLASTDMLYFASGRLDAPGAMFTSSVTKPRTPSPRAPTTAPSSGATSSATSSTNSPTTSVRSSTPPPCAV
jgi:phosphomannomutase